MVRVFSVNDIDVPVHMNWPNQSTDRYKLTEPRKNRYLYENCTGMNTINWHFQRGKTSQRFYCLNLECKTWYGLVYSCGTCNMQHLFGLRYLQETYKSHCSVHFRRFEANAHQQNSLKKQNKKTRSVHRHHEGFFCEKQQRNV